MTASEDLSPPPVSHFFPYVINRERGEPPSDRTALLVSPGQAYGNKAGSHVTWDRWTKYLLLPSWWGWGIKNVHRRSESRAGETEGQTERRKRQLEPVKFGFNQRAFLSVTHVHQFQSPSCHTVVSNKSRRCVFKAVFQPDCGSRAHLWCARSFSWPPDEICSFPESLFPFLLHLKKDNKKDVLNISISVYRYMFVFTVGKWWPFTAKPCLCHTLLQCPWRSSIAMQHQWTKPSTTKYYTYLELNL